MKSPIFFIKAVSILFILSLGTLIVSAFVLGVGRFSVPPFMKAGLQEQKPSPNGTSTPADKDQTTSDIPEAVYKDTLARIKGFRNAGSLIDLIKEGDEIEREWGAKGGERYGLLFHAFLGELTSGRILDENPSAWDLTQEYATAALKTADSYDLETEWALLRYLRYPVEPTTLDAPGIEQRRIRVKLWLHALRRLESEKDKNFNPDETGPMKVEPPPGVNGFPGMAPERIKDPLLRAEYEKAIDENNKKIRYRNHQFDLRRHGPFIIRDAIKYISKMYTQSPPDLKELEQLLAENNLSSELKSRIIGELSGQSEK